MVGILYHKIKDNEPVLKFTRRLYINMCLFIANPQFLDFYITRQEVLYMLNLHFVCVYYFIFRRTPFYYHDIFRVLLSPVKTDTYRTRSVVNRTHLLPNPRLPVSVPLSSP